jgi:hypothetical protein
MGSLTTKKLVAHLKQHVTSQARIFAGRIPDVPNRIISVTFVSGAGFSMDGLFDAVGFQVTCRGAENNFPDAEFIALEVDDILTGKFPDSKSISFWMDDVYVDAIGRTGGGPIQLPFADENSRFTFTCNYYAQVATSIGAPNG